MRSLVAYLVQELLSRYMQVLEDPTCFKRSAGCYQKDRKGTVPGQWMGRDGGRRALGPGDTTFCVQIHSQKGVCDAHEVEGMRCVCRFRVGGLLLSLRSFVLERFQCQFGPWIFGLMVSSLGFVCRRRVNVKA